MCGIGGIGLVSVATVILFAAALMLPFAVWRVDGGGIAAAVVNWRSVFLRVTDRCGRRFLALAGAAAVDRVRSSTFAARGGWDRGGWRVVIVAAVRPHEFKPFTSVPETG
jgi:hypothetical protein